MRSKKKLYIGIDIGSKGFITTHCDGEWQHYSLEKLGMLKVNELLCELRHCYKNIICVIEDVHAIFGSSARSTFSFGFNKGYIVGMVIANRIPYCMVRPRTWQSTLWEECDSIASSVPKEISIRCCQRLFPYIDLRKSERARRIDNNKVDSILLCYYGIKKNL